MELLSVAPYAVKSGSIVERPTGRMKGASPFNFTV